MGVPFATSLAESVYIYSCYLIQFPSEASSCDSLNNVTIDQERTKWVCLLPPLWPTAAAVVFAVKECQECVTSYFYLRQCGLGLG